MKRSHGLVSATPLFLQKKGRTASRQEGLLGTPVEGLTGQKIDTPDSDDRPQRAIPETTQRRLEGFCLSTPLTLSQAAQQETPTLGSKDQPAQHAEPQQQQQPTGHLSHKQPQQAAAGQSTGTGRHRLANISNIPPSPAAATASAGASSPPAPASTGGVAPMETGGTTGRAKRKQHVFFQLGLMSPQTMLLAPSSGSRTGGQQQPAAEGQSATATALGPAAAAHTPYPSHTFGGFAAGTPGSCGFGSGLDEDDGGFVLFTSQSYVRASQPAISPSFAAGLSAGSSGEEQSEPNTTPSQDSREPRPCPSNGTSHATTTASTSFDQFQNLSATAAGAVARAGSEQVQQQQHCQQLSSCGGHGTAGASLSAAPAAAAGGSTTPGDGLGLLLPLGPDMEETTTPELEQIGMASQEGGSQQQQQPQQQLMLPAVAGAGAAAAAAGAAGGGSRAMVLPGSSRGGRGAAGGGVGGPGSSARDSRRPGVVCEEVTTKQVLFPIFRPKSQRKCLILVRHGESTYNRQDAHGKNWSDPTIFDAPLTQKGRQQAVAAQEKVQDLLRRHGHLGSTLWLSSPLTRALETMTLAAPEVEALAAAQGPAGGLGSRADGHQEQRVMVLSLIAEHCATTGDVGRPASTLRSHFPALASPLSELEEQWWFNPSPDEHPNCAVSRLFNKTESIDKLRARVSEFSRWLHSRPEQVVVAFGHSTFWKHFTNTKKRMHNCEVMHMWW